MTKIKLLHTYHRVVPPNVGIHPPDTVLTVDDSTAEQLERQGAAIVIEKEVKESTI